MVIVWSLTAKTSLQKIFHFYLPQIGRKRALHIVNQIERETQRLLLFPTMGKIHETDNERIEYRTLRIKHFKLFYSIETETVVIMLVWDTRRDPQHLQHIL